MKEGAEITYNVVTCASRGLTNQLQRQNTVWHGPANIVVNHVPPEHHHIAEQEVTQADDPCYQDGGTGGPKEQEEEVDEENIREEV